MSSSSSADANPSPRRTAHGENRIPPAVAVLAAIVIYALLPGRLLIAPRLVIPILEAVLLVAGLITNPQRMVRETRWSRRVSIALDLVVIAANLMALVLLMIAVAKPSAGAGSLLIGGFQVWVTNVIGFGLLYWEFDRGGPVARRTEPRSSLQAADWRFSQDENDDNVVEVRATASGHSGWVPIFIDYLYVSLTNSSAFSPTDTMPLSTRAKCLMGIQATVALFTSLIVIARAVGSLGS